MIIDVKLNQSKRDVHKFTASCMVDETIVCTAELLGAVRTRKHHIVLLDLLILKINSGRAVVAP